MRTEAVGRTTHLFQFISRVEDDWRQEQIEEQGVFECLHRASVIASSAKGYTYQHFPNHGSRRQPYNQTDSHSSEDRHERLVYGSYSFDLQIIGRP